MEHEAETLRRRMALHRSYLRAGVVGCLAIKYLRQIAEDEDALNRLPQWPIRPDGPAISPYLRHPTRPLFVACRDAGRDDGGNRCPKCSVKTICDQGRLNRIRENSR